MANAVYWIGQDGNIWYKDAAGTRNMGPAAAGVTRPDANGFYDPWADTTETPMRFDATQIADPAVRTTAPAGGGSGARLNTDAISNTQRSIDQIPGLLRDALAAEDQTYQNTVNGFNSQEGQQRGTYDTSSVTNQQNYDSNFMDSIRSGIKGLGGLLAILRGSGAAGGSVDQNVRDVVGGVTANDIRTGLDTRNENQQQLDTSLSTFLTELGLKRKQNEDTHVNNARAITRDSNTQLQDLFGKMAGFYGDAGDTGNASAWMARAGELTPSIADNSRSQVSAYDTTPVMVSAPKISAFAAPTQPNIIAGAPDNRQIGSGIFTISDRKKQPNETQLPLSAGA